MYKERHVYIVVLLFFGLSLFYFFVPFGDVANNTVLTISTFLFAIFAGFFISRQGVRYSTIRDTITAFDGNMSFLYRASGHFGETYQNKMVPIIKEYYEKILTTGEWHYPIHHKTTILTSCQNLLSEIAQEYKASGPDNMMFNRMVEALRDAQIARKRLVALYQERVPKAQWVLIYFLTILLLGTLSTIPSGDVLIGAILKGAFATSIVFVMLLLHQFDKLRFFESVIGQRSAYDVLGIIEGKK